MFFCKYGDLDDNKFRVRYNGMNLDMSKFIQVKKQDKRVRMGVSVSGSHILDDLSLKTLFFSRNNSNGIDACVSAWNSSAAWFRYIDFDDNGDTVYYSDNVQLGGAVVNPDISANPYFGNRGIDSANGILWLTPSTNNYRRIPEFDIEELNNLAGYENDAKLCSIFFTLKFQSPLEKQYFSILNSIVLKSGISKTSSFNLYLDNGVPKILLVTNTANRHSNSTSYLTENKGTIVSSKKVDDEKWHTIGFTIDWTNGKVILYVDGISYGNFIFNHILEDVDYFASSVFDYNMDISWYDRESTDPTGIIKQTSSSGCFFPNMAIKHYSRFGRVLSDIEVLKLHNFYTN